MATGLEPVLLSHRVRSKPEVRMVRYIKRVFNPGSRAEPGISGLEKTAPPGELEFFSRSI